MIALGYQDDHNVLPKKLKEKSSLPRQRKPLSEIAFLEDLDNPIK